MYCQSKHMTLFNLLVFILYSYSNALHSSQFNTSPIEQNLGQDSCIFEPLTIGLQTATGIFTEGEVPISLLKEDLKLVAFSKCSKKGYEIRSCRLVAIAKNKDPIVYNLRRGTIKKDYALQLLKLGGSFELYFEQIKINSSSTNCRLGQGINTLFLSVK